MTRNGIILISTLLAGGAFASTSASEESLTCSTLKSCIEAASQLTGQKYLFREKKIEGLGVSLTSNLTMTKQNAELVFTNILRLNELTRIPAGEPGTFYIDELKAALQSSVAVYEASADQKPELPNTFDVVTVKYKVKHPEIAAQAQRFLIDFLPRYARVSYFDTGYLFITDSAQNVRRVLTLIDAYDQPLSPAMRKKWEEERRRAEKARTQAAAVSKES